MTRVVLWALVLAAAFAGGRWLEHHVEQRGFAAGYAKAQAEQAQRDLQQANENARLLALQSRNKERIDEEAQKREAARVSRVADLVRSNRSLHATIAELNARPAPADPGAAGFAHEAAVARTLLGECQDRRGEVAGAAEGLRDQVIGLQDYVRDVCLAPPEPVPISH